MRKIWIFLILVCLPLMAFASVEFFALLPNPAGDDSIGEYVEIRNTGCQDIDIGGYSLHDASGRSPYFFPSGTLISSKQSRRITAPELTISLNNSGDESVILKDNNGNILDQVDYSGTQKDDLIIEIAYTDLDCSSGSDSGSGSQGYTGSTETQTGTGISFTGSQDNSSTGGTGTGTGDTNPPDPFYQGGTGTTNTGTTNTGTTNTGTTSSSSGSTLSGVTFPEIVPTRQEPTNATLSGNIWDCGTNQPCRINVTFDPIFTGSYLAKNYTCEVITDMGTLATCNPNTIYFSTGSVWGLRLTSKIDPSQSRMVTWSVVFATSSTSNDQSGTEGTGNTNSGTTSSGSTSSGITFPEIIPTFQNYTNTTNSGDILTCITSPCRVNFTLDPIFTGSFLSRDYSCEVLYGVEKYLSCNPGQIYPVGTGSIEIILTHKASGQQYTKNLQIIQNIVPVSGSSNSVSIEKSNIPTDTHPPIAIIDFDGKMYDYYEQIDTHEFNCYTMTCSVNLSGERSYDPEGGKVRFLWIYGPNDIKTSRDPGGRKYGIGDHEIIMRVIDESGNSTEIRYRIHVLGPNPDIEKEKKTKKKETKTKGGIGELNLEKSTQNQKKVSEISFFDPPEVILQTSKFVPEGDGYVCITKNKNCSINLTLSGTQSNIVYRWDYGDGDIIDSKNPRSHSYDPGIHTIRLTAGYDADTPIWSRDIRVSVEKIASARKPKKSKIVSPKTEQILSENDNTTEGAPIKVVSAEPTETDVPYTTMVFVSSVIPLILVRRYLIGA